MQHFIGCSGFYNKDWKDVFYPKGLPQRKWFEFYCSRFNTLELNTTFYRFPKIEFLQNWYKTSPPDFKFSVKAPRLITHFKQFNETDGLLNDFYAAIQEGLKEKAGPVLFQLPAKITFSEDFLNRIIQSLNKSLRNVVEFRNESWWNDIVYKKLAQYDITFSGISHPKLPKQIIANTNPVYYRFHGIPKLYFSQYPVEEIKRFSDELARKASNKTVYIYFNNTATMAAINNATELEKFLAD